MTVSVGKHTEVTELFAEKRVAVAEAEFITLVCWHRLTFGRPGVRESAPELLDILRCETGGGKPAAFTDRKFCGVFLNESG